MTQQNLMSIFHRFGFSFVRSIDPACGADMGLKNYIVLTTKETDGIDNILDGDSSHISVRKTKNGDFTTYQIFFSPKWICSTGWVDAHKYDLRINPNNSYTVEVIDDFDKTRTFDSLAEAKGYSAALEFDGYERAHTLADDVNEFVGAGMKFEDVRLPLKGVKK